MLHNAAWGAAQGRENVKRNDLFIVGVGVAAVVGAGVVSAAPDNGAIDLSDTTVLQNEVDSPLPGFESVITPTDPYSNPYVQTNDDAEFVGPNPEVAPLPSAGGLGLIGIGVLAARRRRRA